MGFYTARKLWKHMRNCSTKFQKPKGTLVQCRMLLAGGLTSLDLPEIENTNADLKKFCLDKMRRDNIYHAINNDKIILALGKIFIEKLVQWRAHDVVQRMRQLCRLKIELAGGNSTTRLISFINGNNFDDIIRATRTLAGYHKSNDGLYIFEIPSFALRIGHNMIKCAEIMRGLACRENNPTMRHDSNIYIELHSCEWTDRISSIALASLKTKTFNKPSILPLTEDLVLLKDYLDEKINTICAALPTNSTTANWIALGQVTLARILLFNKRRSSEVSKLLLGTYLNHPDWTKAMNTEVLQSLQPMEREMIGRLQLVENLGKHNKKVQILLTSALVQSLECLIKYRTLCHIKETNPYMFASREDGHMDAWQVLQSVSKDAGCKQPQLISSSRLRKYFATICQVLHMEDIELEWLSTHLAHNINTHKQHYRQHDALIEIAKSGRLIMAVDAGQIHKFAGKSRAEINIAAHDSSVDIDIADMSSQCRKWETLTLKRRHNESGQFDSAGSNNDVSSSQCNKKKRCTLTRGRTRSEMHVPTSDDEVITTQEHVDHETIEDELSKSTLNGATVGFRFSKINIDLGDSLTQPAPDCSTKVGRFTGRIFLHSSHVNQQESTSIVGYSCEKTEDRITRHSSVDIDIADMSSQWRKRETLTLKRRHNKSGQLDSAGSNNDATSSQCNKKKRCNLTSGHTRSDTDEDYEADMTSSSNDEDEDENEISLPKKKQRYTIEENKIIKEHFSNFIKNSIVPNNRDARTFIKKMAPQFQNRTISQIKSKVQYFIKIKSKI